jgi:hypothetical protein
LIDNISSYLNLDFETFEVYNRFNIVISLLINYNTNIKETASLLDSYSTIFGNDLVDCENFYCDLEVELLYYSSKL